MTDAHSASKKQLTNVKTFLRDPSGFASGLSVALVMGCVCAYPVLAAETADDTAKQYPTIEETLVEGEVSKKTKTTRLPFAIRELPQSVSDVSREFMDIMAITDINDVLMNVTGINVTLYDSQRPLYFARGFQITDFQVDGIPTYSGSTNQEYDTALYERVEVIRGANGLLSGAGAPSATVNMIRKRPQKEFGAELSGTIGSWDMRRGVADVSAPLTEDGRVRSRFVVSYQDSDSFRDRYSEDKTAMLGVVEMDLSEATTLAVGYQNQDNNPEGTIWGTIPIFAADGSEAKFPVSTSFAPEWTEWQRESTTFFADIQHSFNQDWSLRAALNRTEGDVFSLRVYGTGFPDRETGQGTTLLAGVGAGEDTRDSVDLVLNGSYTALGRQHELVIGANAYELESFTPGFTSLASWSYAVPNAWDYDGQAPIPTYTKTGAFRIATTQQFGVYLANRFRMTDALSLVGGVRLSSWETGTDNYDASGAFVNTTGDYKVTDEVTPYAGIVYDINERFSLYTSYTDVFNPQNYKDKNNNLLAPVLGSNIEAGIKGEFFNEQLMASLAVFNTKQDNYAVRDQSEPDNSLPDGSSAYIGIDGTESEGVELSVSGQLSDRWMINAGYTYVDTKRNENDRIWTNLPEHSLQLSTHYQLTGALERLTLGGGVNWQGETIGYGVSHPLIAEGVTYEQDAYVLANFYATWRFSDDVKMTFSATNLFDETYWANIDYANYGEPRNLSLTLTWKL